MAERLVYALLGAVSLVLIGGTVGIVTGSTFLLQAGIWAMKGWMIAALAFGAYAVIAEHVIQQEHARQDSDAEEA